ncbi:ABC transporter substrate-binding protein [Paenibacillus sp. UMB4589-SE434]|uniref:ABC transporter substrate-binding protein n=1 Tax=Paenibacillus sp. UMB4589-SE434 TaxID=3046314 RepID=UPI002551361E|nr:ABC transporter substrate-binding protein [Paenibacillus sp. UMB4589-SE434]MDK8184037.1 ABC transporter substrate-binding protein [Paenibacillus sp. UMB4589-SE434]
MRTKQQGSRRFLAFILSVVFLTGLVLSGCGNTPSSNSDAGGTKQAESGTSSTVSGSDTAVEPKEAKIKTISTVNGDIEVPVHPQRIVAEEYLGSLIALQVIPVGAPGLTLNNYYFKEALAGVADSGVYGKPSAEGIMSLNPDLIITGNKDVYEMLSKIAPTLVIPYGQLKNVHEELTYFGALFGKEKEAKAWLADYDRRIMAAKAKVDAVIPADASFSIMEDAGKRILVYGDNFGRGGQPTYQALGRKPPAGIGDEIMEKQWAEISAELLEKYAGDYIIMTSNERTVADFQADTIWSSLPAVKNGHIYVWPEERSWYYDPLAVLAQTEELAEWLTKSAK